MNIELTKKTKLLTAGKVCHEDIVILPVLQSKTVTENGVVVPDSGYVGLNHVMVNIPEKEDSVLGNIDKPILPKLGRLKYFISGRSVISYKDMYPCNQGYGLPGPQSHSGAFATDDLASAYFGLYNGMKAIPGTETVFEVNGCVGYPYTDIAAMWCNTGEDFALVPDIYIPPCTCKVALMQWGTSDDIEYAEYVLEGYSFAQRYSNNTEANLNAAATCFYIGCNLDGKQIIGSEFVYPKANVTLSPDSADWMYSIDDGVTFSAVTDEIVLEKVEHFMLKNNSGSAKTIANSSSNFATVNAHSSYAVEVTGETKWVLE